jgi:hypothetical protein
MPDRRTDTELRHLVEDGAISANTARDCRRNNLALRIDAQILAFEVRNNDYPVRAAAAELASRGMPAERCVQVLCRRAA